MPVGEPHFEQDTNFGLTSPFPGVSPCVGKNAAAAQTQDERGGLTAGRKPKPAPKMREESTPKKNGLRPFFKEGPKQKWRKRLAIRRLGTPYDWQVIKKVGKQKWLSAQGESSVRATGSHCACPLSSPIQGGGDERVLLSRLWRQARAPSEARAAESRWLLCHSFNNSSEVRATRQTLGPDRST
ncbi:unnamed protein product [Nyctereutes procyonoides]|uniref:(raccoon dog) hypothetical protein n=1 Tax=Nyctereutes procyonoides TaxID=34880 RepID=A0A811XW06_NYCPR|nr:unnamed protein product [Nyctereutes procyonoides]